MALPKFKSLRADRIGTWRVPFHHPRGRPGRLRKVLIAALAILAGLPAALILIYRFVPPPITPLMLIRMAEGAGIAKRWMPLSRISPNAADAVITSEDNRFCIHHGFDFGAIREAVEEYRDRGELRGASTISMQTAKNLFLWPGRSWLRKGAEAYLTVLLEFLWPKQRILEVYLNIAEWGDGIYGIEAAAEANFRKPAAKLTRHEAALLAAVLPDPRGWRANPPDSYVAERAEEIAGRIPQLGELLSCVRSD
jgi:monofunctional biosynthetic peptidoglycan transglycosylase